jgi:hypothetical protein
MSNIDSSDTALSGILAEPQAEVSTSIPAIKEAMQRRPPFLAKLVLNAALAAAAPFNDTDQQSVLSILTASSTLATVARPFLVSSVRKLFEEGAGEFFQDGMESKFSRSLTELLARYGGDAVAAIAEYLGGARGAPEVISEALRRVADYDSPETLTARWALLRRGLRSKSAVVRDGAILGFASLDDPRAKAVLLEARDVEQIKALQKLIEQVIVDLARNR